jgi:hypothetical protein
MSSSKEIRLTIDNPANNENYYATELYVSRDGFGGFSTSHPSGIPDSLHLATLPMSQNTFVFNPTGGGTYSFRTYNHNLITNEYSSATDATSSVTVEDFKAIESVYVYNLFPNTNTNQNLFGLLGNVDKFTNYPPIPNSFTWESSSDLIYVPNHNFRVTVRPQGSSSPSSTVITEITGLNSNINILNFTVEDFSAISSGLRNFDIVVEAHDKDGRTSAGNTIHPRVENGWATHPSGYARMTMLGPTPILTGGCFIHTGQIAYETGETVFLRHWLDGDRTVNIERLSGSFPYGTAGAFLVYSTGRFDPIDYANSNFVNTGTGIYNIGIVDVEDFVKNRRLTFEARDYDYGSGFISLGIYDRYTEYLVGRGKPFYKSGLCYLSNVVSVKATGSFMGLRMVNTKTHKIHHSYESHEIPIYGTGSSGEVIKTGHKEGWFRLGTYDFTGGFVVHETFYASSGTILSGFEVP